MNITNLLEARTRRRRPALHFETDLEALLFAAACVDELRQTARAGELDHDAAVLQLDQAADVIRACIQLRDARDHTTGDRP